MNYNILFGDTSVPLDANTSLEERIDFCEELLEKYSPWFKYYFPKDYNDKTAACYKAESRLERLATFILTATEVDKEYPWITYYKETKIKNSERTFTDFEAKRA